MIQILQDKGYKIAVLVDEYDAPHQSSIKQAISETAEGKRSVVGESYARTESLTRSFYTFFFKGGLDSPPDCGILIGISLIPTTSIFSDFLSNFMVYSTVDDNKFGPYFGFLDHEVKWLIDSVGTNLSFEELEEWYDGYHFGASVVFNPFAVVSAFHEGKVGDYWAESGSLEVIKHLIKYSGRYGILDLHFLLSGRSLRKKIHRDLQFADLMKTEESYWTLLTNAGYVDARPDMQSSENYYSEKYYSLRIPNKELKEYLTKNFKIELNETTQMYDRFVHSFNHLNNNASDFQKFLFDRFNTLSSYYKLRENEDLETLVNVFESLFIGFDFDHRSLGTLNMMETPVYQILFIKKDIAHVFNIANMDVVSSHIDIDQLLNLPLTEENLSAIKNRRISQFFKTGIKITAEARKAIGHEKYSGAIKTIVREGMQLIKDHLFPHTHG
ncbi:unnamed protein product [Bemisia tabaci]|uniref:AAA-ATPase-like domain-containing protein n=1 Tax=Bemisia tabaci TaxID=7038 RepID=A0A9P0A1H1_BEMTA|nr:unnamed protein product [Bemisia tabaci]